MRRFNSRLIHSLCADKTQVFHDQIEVKQKELQPWKAKINAKQAEIDVATSERDMLEQKAEKVKQVFETAKEDLERLQADHENKVCMPMILQVLVRIDLYYSQRSWANFKLKGIRLPRKSRLPRDDSR